MHEIASSLKDLVNSYDDSRDPHVLLDQCAATLDGTRNLLQEAVECYPDHIAFGIYPHVHVTDTGRRRLNQFESGDDEKLPSWQDVQEKRFFRVSGEVELIRSLPSVNEEVAVKILFAVAHVAVSMKEGEDNDRQ